MFESSTSAFARASYTIDLTGLAIHARDTLVVYASRVADRIHVPKVHVPRSRVGPVTQGYAEHRVPDYFRVR